jgi:predicted GNAT family N-acyltransferase
MPEIQSRIVTYDVGVESIKKVRENVFTKEQGVPIDIEIDGLDPDARHVLIFDAEEVIGTGRMLLDGHIGRIAVEKQYRGRGIGKIIVNELVCAAGNLQLSGVWLSSQCHAKAFYQKIGFFEVGEIYQEADIDHIKMQKNL